MIFLWTSLPTNPIKGEQCNFFDRPKKHDKTKKELSMQKKKISKNLQMHLNPNVSILTLSLSEKNRESI